MGTRVLCLPGAGCPAPMYNDWISVFNADGFDASTVTYPKHGHDEDPTGVSTCDCELHVESLIKERGKRERPVLLVGHSYGALVAARVAQGNPQVMGLVLVSPAPPDGIFIGMAAVRRLMQRPLKYLYPVLASGAFRFTDEDTQELFLNHQLMRDSTGHTHSFSLESGKIVRRLVLNQPPVDPDEIRCPVHVFSGSNDRLIDPDVQRRVSDHYRGSFHSFAGASHMPMFDSNWRTFARDISDTMQRIIATRNSKPMQAA